MSTARLAVVYSISMLVYLQYAIFYKYRICFLCISHSIQLYKLDKLELTLTFTMFTFIILIGFESDYTYTLLFLYF